MYTYIVTLWKVCCIFLQQIQLSWQSFSLEIHPTCDYDSVEVFDGPNITSPSLGKFCGDSLPPTLKTSSNQATIRKTTDYSIIDEGFALTYEEFGESSILLLLQCAYHNLSSKYYTMYMLHAYSQQMS